MMTVDKQVKKSPFISESLTLFNKRISFYLRRVFMLVEKLSTPECERSRFTLTFPKAAWTTYVSKGNICHFLLL